MKYLVVSEAGQPIECQCNGELYLALAMENLSLTDGYQLQPVPWRQSVNARDAGRLICFCWAFSEDPAGKDPLMVPGDAVDVEIVDYH